MPYLFVVMAEPVDLKLTDLAKQAERDILRLVQASPALGICLILATEKPGMGVVTGLIFASIQNRMAFRLDRAPGGFSIFWVPLVRNGFRVTVTCSSILWAGQSSACTAPFPPWLILQALAESLAAR